MNYLPSDFVKRAAAGVTSTVSTVAQVASGKKRQDGGKLGEDSLLYAAKEKAALIVKSSPSKDAATTSNLAVKSGFLLKRNEQGSWQKRFVCLVPHTFLYYFDSELGDAPRGIIDLELYTNVNRDDGILKLESADEDYIRSFYFDDDDKDNLNDWTTSLIRDRYHAVCDERNAYQQMQFEMTGAIDNASNLHKMSEKEREILEQQLFRADQLYLGARNVLQSVLVELGITDEEMSSLTDIEKIGSTVKQRINDLRFNYEHQIELLHEEILSEKQHREQSIEELTKKIENEQVARKNLEVLILKERKDAEKRIKDSEAQIDNITMNFQMAVVSKSSAEAKNNTLNDQKKVLVKEVKQLRKKVDDANVSIEELKSMNEKLVAATNSLQQQLKTALAALEASKLQLQHLQTVTDESTKIDEATSPTANEDTAPFSLENVEDLLAQSSLVTSAARTHSSASSDNLVEHSKDATTPHYPRSPVDASRNDGEHDQKDRTNCFSGGGEESTADGRESWDMSATSLRELGWLTAEQSKMVDKRIGEQSNSRSVSPLNAQRKTEESEDTHNRRGSTLSMFTSVLGGGSSNAQSTDNHESSSHGTSNRRSSLQMISSMFSSTSRNHTPNEKKEEKEASHPPHSDDTIKEGGSRLFFSSPFSNQFDDDESNPERLPKSMRLQCLRCNGTVEGPKFSTCKCVIPALSPDDLNANNHNSGALNMLSGFAGGLAGGLMKATAATASSVSGLVHYTTAHNNQHSATSQPHTLLYHQTEETKTSTTVASAHGEEPLLDLSENFAHANLTESIEAAGDIVAGSIVASHDESSGDVDESRL